MKMNSNKNKDFDTKTIQTIHIIQKLPPKKFLYNDDEISYTTSSSGESNNTNLDVEEISSKDDSDNSNDTKVLSVEEQNEFFFNTEVGAIEWEKQKENGVFIANLDSTSEVYKKIKDFIEDGLNTHDYTSPKKEATRMIIAAQTVNELNNRILSPQEAVKLEKAKKRLNEGSRNGARLVGRRDIVITKIEAVYNKNLYEMFKNSREHILSDRNSLAKVKWSSEKQILVNENIGETFLLHGTLPKYISGIISNGFNPSLFCKNRNENKEGTTADYGMLGQATCFTDVLSKAMTYSRCSICGDYDCDGTDCTEKIRNIDVNAQIEGEAGHKTILARVLLGHPKKMHGKLQAGGSLRSNDINTIKQNRNSIYSQGIQEALYNWFKAGSFLNEFGIKKKEQMYPQFIISWKYDDHASEN